MTECLLYSMIESRRDCHSKNKMAAILSTKMADYSKRECHSKTECHQPSEIQTCSIFSKRCVLSRGDHINFFNTKNASYLKSIIKTYLFVRSHLYHNLSMSKNLNNNTHLCFFRKIYFISSISPPQPALHQRSLQPWNPSMQMSLTEPGIIRTATPFPRSIPRKRRQEN